MIYASDATKNNITSIKRNIKGRVALKGATLTNIDYNGDLINFTVDRVGEEGKFFGFGVSHKATINIRDKDREKDISQEDKLYIALSSADDEFIITTPDLIVDDVKRDENNNNLTLTAYDAIYYLNNITVDELGLNGDYHINTILEAVVNKLELSNYIAGIDVDSVSDKYPEVANLDGTENLREVLNDIAEATQTIYYINTFNELVFRKVSNSNTGLTINKGNYFTTDTGETYTLATLTLTTELGENLTSSKEGVSGVTQYIRENSLLNNNTEAATRLEEAVTNICGTSITEFNCSWRGNFLLEIGDRIEIITKDDNTITSYLINDSYTYSGGLKQTTSWKYAATGETSANPTNIGEAIKQTYARVDKVNKQITLLASEQEAQSKSLAELVINTGNITSTVSTLEENIKEGIDSVNNDISELNSKITQTAENLNIEFTNKIGDIDSITTSTGFTFNKDGLTVSKSGSEMITQITEDGMKVFKNDEEMLTANTQGVNAVNLHATTYLIIGNNSRFEDMVGSSRTGCFWIGG